MGFVIDTGYPYIEGLPDKLELSPPYPYTMMTQKSGEYPKLTMLPASTPLRAPFPYTLMTAPKGEYPRYSELPQITPLTSPYPYIVMVQRKGEYPSYGNLLGPRKRGAFTYAHNLTKVRIAKSVKQIGRWSFHHTSLASVNLPDGCKYYSTSFPADCVVSGGTLIDSN